MFKCLERLSDWDIDIQFFNPGITVELVTDNLEIKAAGKTYAEVLRSLISEIQKQTSKLNSLCDILDNELKNEIQENRKISNK